MGPAEQSSVASANTEPAMGVNPAFQEEAIADSARQAVTCAEPAGLQAGLGPLVTEETGSTVSLWAASMSPKSKGCPLALYVDKQLM